MIVFAIAALAATLVFAASVDAHSKHHRSHKHRQPALVVTGNQGVPNAADDQGEDVADDQGDDPAGDDQGEDVANDQGDDPAGDDQGEDVADDQDQG